MNIEAFKNAPRHAENTLCPFWFWNDALDDDRLRAQLAQMDEKGIRQAVIHARTYMDPGCMGYLTEDWFAHVRAATEEARRRGMLLWIYDENNWPSGTIDCTLTKNEAWREHFLRCEKTRLSPGDEFELPAGGRDYVCVAAMEDGEPVRLLAENGAYRYMAVYDCFVAAIYVDVDPYEGDGMRSIDYLSREAIGQFIAGTHKQYEAHFPDALGETLRGTFMDETRFCNAYPWTAGLDKLFIEKKGYDLAPLLPLLFCDGPRAKYVRFDYFDFISDVCAENLFRRVMLWCDQNGVSALAHFLGEETLAAQSYFGADMMRYYKYLHVPGLDHLGNGIGGLGIKNGVSAAQNYGRGRVFCEAFGGAGADATLEDVTRIANWLFQQGVDQIMIHGFAYSMRPPRDADWPPSYFDTWPYWDRMGPFAETCARMSAVAKNRFPENEILVYHPIETFWNHFVPDTAVKTGFFTDGPAIRDARAAEIDGGCQRLGTALLDRGLDFTVWNADSAPNFEIRGGLIVNKLTQCAYRVVVLPYVELLPAPVHALLKRFIAGGGRVVALDCRLDALLYKDGSHMTRETGAALEGLAEARSIGEAVDFCAEAAPNLIAIEGASCPLSRSLDAYPEKLIDPYLHDGERLFGVAFSRFSDGPDRIFDLTNYNMTDEHLSVRVYSTKRPVLLNPETGDGTPEGAPDGDGFWRFGLDLPANRKRYVVCGK